MTLVFARILLQSPPWVLIDDAFGALDSDMQTRVADIFTNALPRTAVVHIGRAGPVLDALFTRVVKLVKVAPTSGGVDDAAVSTAAPRSEEHTSELQSLMRISYAVFCL